MIHHLVHLGISPWEKAVRTALVYAAILALLRLAGKRQLAQLNSFDLVVLLLLSNVVQNAIIGPDDSLLGGLLGAVILIALNQVIVRSAFLSPLLDRVLQGDATTVVKSGRIDERALRQLTLTREELIAGLRRQGLELEDTEKVTLEPEGTFNATPKPKPSLDDVMRKLNEIEAKLATR
ncbi:MAG: putative rane protein [Actinomycetia bacterium]|nr:putative rane protein [Actinomycetes bacterium]